MKYLQEIGNWQIAKQLLYFQNLYWSRTRTTYVLPPITIPSEILQRLPASLRLNSFSLGIIIHCMGL